MAKCIDDILKAAAGSLTRKEAEAIINEVEARFGKKFPKTKTNPFKRPDRPGRKQTGGVEYSADESGSKSRETLMQEAAVEAFQEKVNAKKQVARRRELQVEKQAIREVQLAKLGGDVKAIEAMLVDPRGEVTLQGRIRAIREKYLADLTEPLEALAKDEQWRRMDPVEREVRLAEALMDQDIVQRKTAPPGKGVKWDAVDDLAMAYRLMDDAAYTRKNEAGADIQYTKGHMPQVWDSSGVRLFGLSAGEKARMAVSAATRKAYQTRARQRWIDYVLPRIDRSRYPDPETGLDMADDKLREMLSDVWQTIASNGLTGDVVSEGGNLAEQLGAHRQIWFKDARSFVESNREFGARDLFSAITGEAVRHAKDIALLETYGPNPTMGFKTDLAHAMARQAEDNPGAGRKGSHRAQLIFDELSGKSIGAPEDRAAIDSLAKYDLVSRSFKGLRNLIASAKLGMLPFLQINDLATFRAIAKSDGLGAGKTIRAAISLFNPANASDRKAARRHGILAQMVLGDAALRYGGDTGNGQGWTSKLANATVKWSGAQHWTDSLKQAFQVSIGWHLADAKNISFDQLSGKFGEMIRRYGITAKEWDIIRSSETVTLAGEQTITPHTVSRYVPREYDAKAYAEVRSAAEKVGAMMAEEADFAILQPDAKTRTYFLGKTSEGEISGEIVRSIAFFKTFSIAMITKAIPRVVKSGEGAPLGKTRAFTEFLLIGTIAGAMTIQLKELAKGRNPRDMDSLGFMAAAFMQSGGLGIFGDFMFSDANRFGGDLAESFLGPVVGFAGDFKRLTVGNVQQVAEGKDPKLAAETIQFIKNYTPLMNLWYTRLALDHALFFHAQEAANPGYLRRVRRRVERQQNQSWWWSPDENQPKVPDLKEAFGGR